MYWRCVQHVLALAGEWTRTRGVRKATATLSTQQYEVDFTLLWKKSSRTITKEVVRPVIAGGIDVEFCLYEAHDYDFLSGEIIAYKKVKGMFRPL